MKKTNMSEDTPKMWKKCEKLRKNSPTWPQEFPKRVWIIWSAVSALPCLASWTTIISPYEVLVYHAGGRTPAHCDASRISAGVLFRDSAPAFFKSVNALPDSPPNSFKIHPKIGPNPPKTLPNPPEILPNPSQNRSRSFLGSHFGLLLYKSSILNAPEMAKKRPRVTKRRPRAPQPLPKWSPRPSQIYLWSIFFDLIFPYEICMDFWLIFASSNPWK